MNQTVKQFIEKHRLLHKEDDVIVAVSGGPDSMALLHFLLAHSSLYNKIYVAHVEHGLRGESSIKDMEFVKQFCEEHHIPFYYHQTNVNKVKEKWGFSTQEAARFCRYEWFRELMNKRKASKLATAHHGDDQVETILMRQVRGSVSGLRGIPVKREFGNGMIIRPLLCVDKQQIIEYCRREKVPYKIDESNESESYQRNRFRKHVLPFLKEENSKVHETFQRQSEWFFEEDRFLQNLTKNEIEKAILEKSNDKITLHIERFLQLPIALQRRGVHLILNYLSEEASTNITTKHLELIINMMKKDTSSSTLHLPKGIHVEKVYKHCDFYCVSNGIKVKSLVEKEIKIPGMTYIQSGKIKATIVDCAELGDMEENENVFYADINKLNNPLFIRSRKHGDKITPIGLKGTKKVNRIFIDKKVPKRERDEWPIVVDKDGEILWIPCLTRSNKALIDQHTENVLILAYEKLRDDEENRYFSGNYLGGFEKRNER